MAKGPGVKLVNAVQMPEAAGVILSHALWLWNSETVLHAASAMRAINVELQRAKLSTETQVSRIGTVIPSRKRPFAMVVTTLTRQGEEQSIQWKMCKETESEYVALNRKYGSNLERALYLYFSESRHYLVMAQMRRNGNFSTEIKLYHEHDLFKEGEPITVPEKIATAVSKSINKANRRLVNSTTVAEA